MNKKEITEITFSKIKTNFLVNLITLNYSIPFYYILLLYIIPNIIINGTNLLIYKDLFSGIYNQKIYLATQISLSIHFSLIFTHFLEKFGGGKREIGKELYNSINDFFKLILNKSELIIFHYHKLFSNFLLYVLFTFILFVSIDNFYSLTEFNFFLIFFLILIILARIWAINNITKNISSDVNEKSISFSLLGAFASSDLVLILIKLIDIDSSILNKIFQFISSLKEFFLNKFPEIINSRPEILITIFLFIFAVFFYNKKIKNPFEINSENFRKFPLFISLLIPIFFGLMLVYFIISIQNNSEQFIYRFSPVITAFIGREVLFLIFFFLFFMIYTTESKIINKFFLKEHNEIYIEVFEAEIIGIGEYEYADFSILGFKFPKKEGFLLVKKDNEIKRILKSRYDSLIFPPNLFFIGDVIKFYTYKQCFELNGNKQIEYHVPKLYELVKKSKLRRN